MKNIVQKRNRNNSYAELNLTRKQFENCLLPLWHLGQSTAQETAEYIKLPINEVVGRFRECWEKGFIAVNPVQPDKINERSGKRNTNYILTEKGKNAVKTLFSYAREVA